MLLDHCYEFGLLLWLSSLKKNGTYFASPWLRPLADLMNVPGHDHFIPTKFRKPPLRGSVVKADYVFPYIYMH